jgi:hypothetical protein
MRPTISKHCAGRNYNSPLSQLNSNTKLKDVPGQIGGMVRNAVSNSMDAIGNVTVGNAGKFVANALFPGASAIVGNMEGNKGNGMVRRNNPFNVDPGHQNNAFTSPTRPSGNSQLTERKKPLKPKSKPVDTKPNDSSITTKGRRAAEEIFDEVAAKGY